MQYRPLWKTSSLLLSDYTLRVGNMSTTLTKHSGDSPLDRSEEITVRGKRLHIPVGGSDSSEERAEVEEDESYTVYGAAPYLSRELSPNVVGEPKPEQVSVEEGSILPFDELDSRRAVKQLAASLASSPKVLKIFMTHLQYGYPLRESQIGIPPITAAVREYTENLKEEESKSL